MVVEKQHEKAMNGNVTFAGLNFQEREEEEHLKKLGNNGEAPWNISGKLILFVGREERYGVK
ncbi:MAG: hypothetical protein ACXACP_04690 [Candidatus Hodarchaeales archaeon]